jgi:glycosyltransferase involved in cell wall biosynthesis
VTQDRLRILVLAPDASPESITGPLIGYSQAQALARLHDVTIVVRSHREEVLRRRPGLLRGIEVVKLERLDRVFNWIVRRVFKNDFMTHAQTLTAFFRYPFCIAFEWQAWRQLRARIVGGEFDVVYRLLPIPAVLPSPFAFFLRKGPVPFVIGPISGGLPWPTGFSQAQYHRQWLSNFRGLYRYLPFARGTYRHAAAIIAGASQTHAEFAAHGDKVFFLLENGVHSSLCSPPVHGPESDGPLELIFVGSLTPVKGCDLALRGAATLLRDDSARLTIVGDGPERRRLEQLTRSLGVEKAVRFCGFLAHREAMERLRLADVLVFPSVRDNNPAVVFEALAAGAVPVVADFGGPGDIVRKEFGYKLSLTNEADVVSQIEKILTGLGQDRSRLERLRQRAMSHASESLTWDAKAHTLTEIMLWVLRRGPKPNLPPPNGVSLRHIRADLGGIAPTTITTSNSSVRRHLLE